MIRLLRVILHRLEEALALAVLLVLTGVMAAQVFTRYGLGDPLVWTEEAARWLYVWLVFLGAAVVTRDRGHVAILVLLDRLPPWPRALLAAGLNLAAIGFLVAMVVVGLGAADRVADQEAVTFELSLAWLMLPVPVACASMALRLAFQTWDDLRAAREGRVVHAATRSLT